MQPMVSVIVATYRAGEYLQRAIASALAQKFGDFEIIVSDDAADPAVKELAESFHDSRIRYRANASRLGPAGNHWAGFTDARGRYLAILNHDDMWHTGFLESLIPPLESDADINISFCDHEVIDGEGKILVEATAETSQRWGRTNLTPGHHQTFYGLVAQQTIPIAMGSVFRKSAIDFAALKDVGPAYDLWLAYLLAQNGGSAWYTSQRLSQWRVHPSQLTACADLSWSSGSVQCWKAMRDDDAYNRYRKLIHQNLGSAAIEGARISLAKGSHEDAHRFSRLALKSAPTHWRSWAAWMLCCLPMSLQNSLTRKFKVS